MTDERETDLLAYILCGFVIAISGIAVGVASTTPGPDVRQCAANDQGASSDSPCGDGSAGRLSPMQKD
jgi:hypothetical protein